MSALQLLEHYRDRVLSPVEVTQAVLARIEQVPPNTPYSGALVAACERLAKCADPTVADRAGISAWPLAQARGSGQLSTFMRMRRRESRT